MRVISGCARGTKLSSPRGLETRPTLDRVKEAVFSMILPYLCNSSFLDAFAGSGAIGIEALSRGASNSVFIDSSPEAISCINDNLKITRLTNKAKVVLSDTFEYLLNNRHKFDVIFIDPPYSDGFYDRILDIIDKHELLSDNGIIVAEWDYEIGFTTDFHGFTIAKEKKYGRVGITVLKKGS